MTNYTILEKYGYRVWSFDTISLIKCKVSWTPSIGLGLWILVIITVAGGAYFSTSYQLNSLQYSLLIAPLLLFSYFVINDIKRRILISDKGINMEGYNLFGKKRNIRLEEIKGFQVRKEQKHYIVDLVLNNSNAITLFWLKQVKEQDIAELKRFANELSNEVRFRNRKEKEVLELVH